MKRIVYLVLLLFLISNLIGCTSPKESIDIENDGVKIEVKRLTQEKIDSGAFVDTDIRYVDNRYVLVTGQLNSTESQYFFDTKEEEIVNLNELEVKTNKRYIIIEDDNIISIMDKQSNKEVFAFTLQDYGFNESPQLLLSNTGEYLQVRQLTPDRTMLFNIHTKSIVNLPIEGDLVLNWSTLDKKVIVDKLSDSSEVKSVEKRYLWDIEKNKLIDINLKNDVLLEWSHNDKYIYYIEDLNKIVRYDVEQSHWDEVFNSELRSIDVGSIKWISDNEFVFTGNKRNSSIIPLLSYFKNRFKYYAVRADIKNGTSYLKELDVETPGVFIFSYDNNYVYYIAGDGLVKEKVGLGR